MGRSMQSLLSSGVVRIHGVIYEIDCGGDDGLGHCYIY
jgi:hypothetical protein